MNATMSVDPSAIIAGIVRARADVAAGRLVANADAFAELTAAASKPARNPDRR